ncbi:MAG: VWA domain-containing protein [Methylococcales bacterium]|nr:VWA domain-containing protein [Methylococcales bacterium]MEE2767310.1 VWA domain-containing protein [Pseudomonadota bacterium]
MFEFSSPASFLVLPLPWLYRFFLRPAMIEQRAALRVPFFNELKNHDVGSGGHGFRPWRLGFLLLVWILLVTASARPRWIGEPIQQGVSGRDLLMAVDLSGSMKEKDFLIDENPVDRLTAAKAVAGQFIERRFGDRIGLILFGGQAYLQAPLTFDRKTVLTFLKEAAIGLAGEQTAIGDAIGLAVKRLAANPTDQRVLVLLTDGANTAGQVPPIKAAELARKQGLKIYTIGVGADEMVIRDFFGARRVNPSAELDEDTLREIADRTGGRYFRARDIAELENIYLLLDQLEPVEKGQQFYRPRKDLFHWPLGLALGLTILFALARLEVGNTVLTLVSRGASQPGQG